MFLPNNNSNTYADKSTTTLWWHIKAKHPEILNEGEQEQEDNQGIQKREKVFIIDFYCQYLSENVEYKYLFVYF